MRAAICAAVILSASVAWADEPRAQFRLDGGQPHVGMPFTLQLIVEGFDETPAPDVPKIEIPNATVTPIGPPQPNMSRSIQIVNGRRTDSVRVTWALQWRVEVSKEGALRVPQTTVTQGAKKAVAQAGDVEVQSVPVADDMKVSLDLPNRPVFVGETVPITLTWTFRRDPQDQTFSVPMLATDAFTVSAPAPVAANGQRARTLTLSGGAKDLQLAYTIDKTTVGGVEVNRLQATFYAAPKKVGSVAVPPASVVAALAVGRADFFGNAPTRLFRASDVARTLEVKPLPETDRPVTFAGAVGDQFSISVRTSRSVVSLGEPMQLDVTVKSNQLLDNLSLGKLDGDGRLPKDKFTVPAEAPVGELSDEGKTKTFKVTAQVTGPTTEVPALAFSYFDPAKNSYVTIHSEPIALSVKGGSVVGAGDVVALGPTKPKPGTQTTTTTIDTTTGVLLALSSMGAVGDQPLGGTFLWILVGLLYALPLAMFAVRTWQLRTRDSRDDAEEVRRARRRVEALLDDAAKTPAREIAGALAAALRELAKTLGRDASLDNGLLAKLETESFAPSAASLPLSADVRSDAAGLLRRWIADARKPLPTAVAKTVVVLLVGLMLPHAAHAAPLEEGRVAYQQAMELTTDATARKASFARAAAAFGDAVRTLPDRPELLADWGNAALGAGDVATATLAYRRALALDGSNARARHNLAWLRNRQSELYRPTVTGTTDTLLFFHAWPTPRKLIVGAVAFAIAILLLVPWTSPRRRGLTGLAALPLVIWVAMIASVILADNHVDDAVVMEDVILRAADSTGAPAALPSPLPRGVEVSIRERRDAWTRVELASGTVGWVPSGAVERVLR